MTTIDPTALLAFCDDARTKWVRLDTDTVRALVAAYVEREDGPWFRSVVHECCEEAVALRAEVADWKRRAEANEEIDRRAGMLAGVQAERDASRTAHVALVAELRALCDDSDHGWVHRRDLLALLDRHAPTTGATL